MVLFCTIAWNLVAAYYNGPPFFRDEIRIDDGNFFLDIAHTKCVDNFEGLILNF